MRSAFPLPAAHARTKAVAKQKIGGRTLNRVVMESAPWKKGIRVSSWAHRRKLVYGGNSGGNWIHLGSVARSISRLGRAPPAPPGAGHADHHGNRAQHPRTGFGDRGGPAGIDVMVGCPTRILHQGNPGPEIGAGVHAVK